MAPITIFPFYITETHQTCDKFYENSFLGDDVVILSLDVKVRNVYSDRTILTISAASHRKPCR